MMENRMNFLNKHLLLQCATVVREMKIYWVFSKQNMSLDSTSGFCENLHAYVIIKLVLKKFVEILYPIVTGWKWSEFSYFLKIVFQVQYHKNWNQKPHKKFHSSQPIHQMKPQFSASKERFIFFLYSFIFFAFTPKYSTFFNVRWIADQRANIRAST